MFDLPRGQQPHCRAAATPIFDFAIERKALIPSWQSHPLPAAPQPKPDYQSELRPRFREYNYQRDSAAPNFQDVLDPLDNVVQSDLNVPQFSARCPAHADHNNSLSLALSSEGLLLFKCHAECNPKQVWRAMGMPRLSGYSWSSMLFGTAERSKECSASSGSRQLSSPSLTWPELAARLRQPSRLNAPGAAADWATLLAEFEANDDEGLIERTAQILGIDLWALKDLGVGFDPVQIAIIFPEFDGQGRVVGLATRQGDGRKQMLPRSHRGLYLSADSLESVEPIFVCEGPTDAAALMTMGLPAIGRPSAFGGIEHLVDLLGAMPRDREIIILGENDEKSDGRWPGREAAIKTADTLRERLGRTVEVALPLDGAKDVRAWLLEQRESQYLEVK